MLFSSSSEFIIVASFILLQLIFRAILKTKINGFLLGISNLLILSLILTPSTIGIHLILSSGIFFIGKHVRNQTSKSKKLIGLSIIGVITLFCIRSFPRAFGIESFNLFGEPSLLIQRLGISYIMFRHIKFLTDCYKSNIRQFSLIEYINYIMFFPNFLAGPIDSYQNFYRWRKKDFTKPAKALILPGIGRITLGFIKKYLIVPLFYTYAISYVGFQEWYSDSIAIILSLTLYSFYIYLDFSGYSDIAIGTGYLLGVRTPENFDSPYLSTNIADFWRRWHITFSDFLRDLIFKPIVKSINKVGIIKHRLTVSIIGYMLTFFICGIWHGDTVNFVYWGLWHGAGLAFFKYWSGTKIRNSIASKLNPTVLAITGGLITFIFVTIGWMFFNYKGSDLTNVVKLLISW